MADRLRRARRPIRAGITRTITETEEELLGNPINMLALQAKEEKFDDLLEEVSNYDQQILDAMLDANATETEHDVEYASVEDYKDRIRLIKVRLNQVLNPRESDLPKSPTPSEYSTAPEGKQRNFKLPKIELMKFNGDYEEWLGWWAQFSKIHEDGSLHESDKFHYLVQAMVPGTRSHNLVKSYTPTAENYPKVIEALKDRFGDKSLLAEVYIRKLQAVVLGLEKSKSKFDLCKIYDEIETQLRCLESLEIVLSHSAFLLPLIESSLPIELVKIWQRTPDSGYLEDEKKTTEERLKSLMRFLKREVKGEERIKMIQGKSEEKNVKGSRKYRDDVPTAQSLYSGTVKPCIFCDKTNHSSQDCLKATHMTLDERSQKVKDGRGCFTCFKKGHSSKTCKSSVKCLICGKRHYAIMCRDKEGTKPSDPISDVTEATKTIEIKQSVASASYTNKDGLVLMKTVRVGIRDSTGQEYRARLLFDEGSNRSYIKTATAERLKCPVVENFKLQTTLFGGQKTESKPKKRYSVKLHSTCSNFEDKFELINEDVICGNCPTVPKGPWMQELSKKNIQVNDTGSCSSEIEILIGSNLWPTLMTGRMCKLQNGLIAVESVFGWTLSGEIPNKYEPKESMSSTAISLLTRGEESLPDLWRLEAVGITDPAEQATREEHDGEVKAKFKKDITRMENGRYVIKFPWIDVNIPLPSYKTACEKRLQSTSNKLKRENLFDTYNQIFKDWEAEGIIEEVQGNTEKEHYLPHHRVLKPDSKTTPVRPVFDGSFKIGNHPSLNECLEKGPNLLELIPTILMRFREKEVGVISDIRKAYQMISVTGEDKNFQKFLWWEDQEMKKLKIYRHCRVVFGLNCSPFILAAVMEHHFENVEDSMKPTAQLLRDSLYVDNSVLSFETVEQYKKFKMESIAILKEAKMDLRQWESNYEADAGDEITNVLGLLWNKRDDTLMCKVPNQNVEEFPVTKRSVLSIISKIYDPIGFTSSTMLQPKLMLQSSWALQMDWDDEWDSERSNKFLNWYYEVNEIARIKIPRIAIGSHSNLQIHLFTDASQDAYSAVVFTRVEFDGQVKVQLLLAKSRLAPLTTKKDKKAPDLNKETKRITIPRLELLGCVIGARLLHSVKKSLNLEDVAIHCWSDSTTALAWIKRDEDWGTFVGNRVRAINKLTEKGQWRHVPGHLNPADLPSRGCSPKELLLSKWWEGPRWLYDQEEDWPNAPQQVNEQIVAEEKKKTIVVVNVATDAGKRELKFGSYWKNLRTQAWVRRFIANARSKLEDRRMSPHLSHDEIKLAEIDLIREIQKFHFPKEKVEGSIKVYKSEEDRLLHVKTRLDYKQDTLQFKSPILLPNRDPLVLQLIEFVHRIYCHAGTQFVLNKLRERYWIVQGRRTVKNVIQKCVTCRRFAGKSLQCDPAPLPSLRVDTQCAFETTGVDLAGPFYLKGGNKAWVVLYTCAVYRGIYLDIVDSLSSEEFIDSLNKFTCTVGRPRTMFSDNGTNFVGAQTIMKRLNWKSIEAKSHVKQIVWRFNPPTAAWWGGWWERLVRTLKDLMKRMISRAKLTRKQLATVLAEISHVINNRPLTTLTEDYEDLIPLTPSMFMRDLPVTGLPEVDKMTSRDYQEAYLQIRNLKEELKARFRKEYLGDLIQRKAEKSTPDPKVGDVVLVGYDNRKRFDWPMGRIVELYPGRGNKIRTAKVKTASGYLDRPLQRLFPLEVTNPSTIEVTEEVKAIAKKASEEKIQEAGASAIPDKDVKRTRIGRVVKQPLRYGQWFS